MTGHPKPASPTTVEPTQKHESELLDEGLEESFPASDPVSVSVTRVKPGHGQNEDSTDED